MAIKNKVMLITYPDSLGKNLKELNEVLHKDLKGAVGGIHLLPFFPSTGDRGFAPTDYTTLLQILSLAIGLMSKNQVKNIT